MDRQTQRGYHLLPGPNDGSADSFSSSDVWVFRYHGSEDLHGQQGNAAADALGAYLNGEDVDSEDVVVWYCGHLLHHSEHGGDDWHSVGPNLAPFGNW
jgi:Cu2+-containing amine oxidase